MRNLIGLIVFAFVLAAFTSIPAQPPTGGSTPAGKSDSGLRDDNVRLRSVELERIKREAEKGDPAQFTTINSTIETKFGEIKEDFEGIQISQTAIIQAYAAGKNIDYKLITASAEEIYKKAKRLDSNLFSAKFDFDDKKYEKSLEEKKSLPRDLIIDLDNAVGELVASKLFQNLKVFEPETARKARTDLAHIIKTSEALRAASSAPH